MSSKNDEALPGPSNAFDVQASTSGSSRNVHFDAQDDDIHTGARRKRTESQVTNRRQSMVGQSGYVSQLLDQYVEKEATTIIPADEPIRKPIRKQSLEERRASVKAIETDVNFYMKDAIQKSKSLSTKKSGSKIKLPTISSKEKFDEAQVLSKVQPPDLRLNSDWRPSDVLDDQKVGERLERSWVGTYIVGKDYWTTENKEIDGKAKTVSFSMDEERKPWYDMPLQKASKTDSVLLALKHKSKANVEALKKEIDEKYEEKRKQRLISAAHAREEPKVVDEWSEEFKECFQNISRSSEFSSHRGTRLSMIDADKWLEKAGILDHDELTLVHTGFCFLSSGGSRHQGLSFNEFTHFLQMISYNTKLSLRDITRRLKACQRKPEQVLVQ